MGIIFYAAVVFGLDKNILFKSVLGHCEWLNRQPCIVDKNKEQAGSFHVNGASESKQSLTLQRKTYFILHFVTYSSAR